ncbi:MAG TPA: amino acid adenylation domain-containing protein, partial [Longimicrobium sp.]|nr:amino acid adenylation domain-containing protein [Longimicrobium sp.]
AGAQVPIGRPVANTRAYVLDAGLGAVPIGIPGELYIGGAQVTRGYLGRPGLTAERFVPDPFADTPGARLYRTGDRARWLADGVLEYVGRADAQVKVRGFRIELGEIETLLRGLDGVRDCVVVAREDRPGDRRLVAYVAGDADAEAMRAALRRSLPEYMVPGAFVTMDALPLTPGGKLDRKALPAPDFASAADAYVAPRTPAEEALAGIWAEVLHAERVGVGESFFALGGHSLLAIRMVSRVRDVLGVELPVRVVFEAPTVAEMAARVEEMRLTAPSVLPPVMPADRTGPLPLSFAQERMWFLHRMEPESALYNVPVVRQIQGGVDAPALERALGEVIRRHELLRTTFPEVDGAPLQVIHPFTGFALATEDLSGLYEDARTAEVRRRVDAEAVRPFDLSRGPLLRPALLRLGDADHVLLLCMHHVLTDEWSTGVLFRELSVLYAAFREGRPSPLPELPIQYADYAVWQREQMQGEALERQLAYWTERLAGAPALLELPTDHPRPAVQTYRGASEGILLPRTLLDGLHAVGRDEGATLYMVVLAAFQVLLGRYAGSDDVVVGSPVSGRTRREVEELIGLFLNTLVLRTELGGDPSFRQLLGRVRGVTLGAFEHQEVPFEQLVEVLQPGRSLSHAPLFQVMFILQDTDGPGRDGGGRDGDTGDVQLRGIGTTSGTSKFDLTLGIAPHAQGLSASIEYNTDLFAPATIRRMLGHLARVLEQVAADADVRLSGIDLLGDAERRQVVAEWNATDVAYPSDAPVHAEFEAQADLTPDAPAVISRDGEPLSYAQLDARANRLAHHLVRLGVGPDDRVGLCLERGPEMMAAVLGILKAGAAYVPLDPAYPAERLAYMLENSAARVLVTQSTLTDALPATGAVVVRTDADAAEIARASADRPRIAVSADHLAYVIYTSGSTGRPKGVAMPHRPLVNLLAWQEREWMHPSASATLQFTTLSFDVSFQEIFSCWRSGGRLVLVSEDERRDLAGVLDQLESQGIERIFLPYVALQALADVAAERGTVPARLREVQTAGEQLRVTEPLRRFFQATGAALSNQYGPSETHVVTAHRLEADPAAWPLLPGIGRPIANTQCYVLDAALRPAPVGIPGELYLGGDNVARGYLGRPALTAERFVPDPFSSAGARVYRTGDRARWMADGTLEFLGRTDEQVKIRGFRIEPGEIEAVLAAHDGVREAVVVVREDAPGDRRLVGYVVAADASAVTPAELRAHLKARMPEYMVPSAVVLLDALPLTPSGKVARRALPAPEGGEAEGYVAPRTIAEEILAGIFADVLRLDRVGAGDDFFALGGHSLLATRVVARAGSAFGTDVSVRAIFEAPTVAALAARVEALRGAGAGVQAPPVAPVPRDGPLPLSFAQQRLWFIQQMQPASAAYNLLFALRLRGPLDADALGRALDALVERHESLRTRFPSVDGEPAQVVDAARPVPLARADLSGIADAAAREAALAALHAAEAGRPFDLAAGPLLRCTLVRLGDGEHAMLFALHHIVADGWSMAILAREVSALYGAFSEGRDPSLPPLPVQYAEYAAWQRAWLAGDAVQSQVGYWRERLADVPALELPTDRPRPAVQGHRGGAEPLVLSAAASDALRRLSRAEGATVFMTLLATLQLLLSRLSGQEDFATGSPIAGRTRAETEGLIGFFLNNLVLRADLAGDPTFRELLHRVRETTLGAYAHQEIPFESLIEELRPPRDPARTPFFQVLVNMIPVDDGGRVRFGSAVAEPLEQGEPEAKFDLALNVVDGDELRLALVYNRDLFDAATARRMLGWYEVLLESAVAAPDRRISTLPLLRDDERAALARDAAGRGPAVPFAPLPEWDAEDSLATRFAAQVRATPDGVAVETDGHRWTYAELDARANGVAHALLRACGAGDGRVALFLDHEAPMLAGLLGALKAGKTYVPLDISFPAERVRRILADVEPAALLTEAAHADAVRALADDLPVRVMEDVATGPAHGVEGTASPDAAAYILYTSGSTGEPKGVVQSHRNVLRHIRTYAGRLGVRPGDRLSLFSGYGFDAAVMDIYAALLTGATLCPIGLRGPAAADLPGAVLRRGVTVFHSTPTVYRHLAAQLRPGHDLSAIRAVVLGGEAVVPADLEAFREHFAPDALFVNGMGPTECTVALQYFADERTPAGGAVPVGFAVEEIDVRLLNAAGEPVETFAMGEITVRGAHVALGYWRRPELTRAAFLPDPDGGARRIYRTGDFGRLLPDGAIAFAGRRDGQVKIRGFRVETGEIESVLRRHAGVAECAVLPVADGGETRLVAYVVGRADAGELRGWVRGALPEHMVPAAFVSIDSLPLTPNGKLDRRALPAADLSAVAAEYVAPRTEGEEILAGIYAEVLRQDRVGAGDDFFARGGHSLLATRLISRVRAAFGVELPLHALFESPTVAALAARVDALGRAGGVAQAPPIVPLPRDGALPLSFAQQRLWFLDQLQPGSAAYNLPRAVRLTGALDGDVLGRALSEVVRRHEALRTRFPSQDGAPVQLVDPAVPVALPVTDLRDLPADEREAEARRRAHDEARAPFDLAAGPLLRASLLRLADDDHVLLLTLHHAVSDGWSTGILVREVSILYGAFGRGESSPLAELPVQYADYAAWQRAWLTGEVVEGQIGYWKARLAGAPPLLDIPTDRPRPLAAGDAGGSVPWALPAETAAALRTLSRHEGATLFMTLLAAWQLLLSRYAGEDDVSVGTPVAGRTRLETEGLIGFFVNTLVLRADLSGRPSFRALLGRVRETTLSAHQHQDVPFERLVEELAPERSLGHSPLFQAMFILQNNAAEPLRLGDLEAEALPGADPTAQFDLALTLAETDGGLAGTLGYRAELWDAGTMERMADHFRALLEAVVAHPDRPAAELSFLDDAERARVLEDWNATDDSIDSALVHERFAAQAARAPDAIAVVSGDAQLTYGALDRRANQLAHHLRRRGVGPEVKVALCIERSPEMLVAMLGVLKAGGAYVPLDPAHPAERIRWALGDADARVLLNSARLAGSLGTDGMDGVDVIRLDADCAALDAESDVAPADGAAPENLAYVIYTSGSTGLPKGVQVQHRAVAALLHWLERTVRPDEAETVLASTSITFDVSVAELFGTLCRGGRLVLVGNALDLADVPAAEDVRSAFMVPAAAAELLRAGALPASLRALVLGGEALPAPLARALHAAGVARVLNLYGPTEATVYATGIAVPADAERVTIGRPVPNTRVYALDAGLEPVPAGVPGELCIGGAQVARGYLGRPGATAERFVPDPFAAEPGARLYRTGDRVRWTADGELDYLGRMDFQVKVRGFRIEPGEVESVLRAQAGVADAVVVAREDAPGERRLVAYITADGDSAPDAATLRAALAGRLPEYMVPSAFVVLDALPRTGSGKTDRRALPAPDWTSANAYVAPRTTAEELVAGIFAEVLRAGPVGAGDDFFALGGHSLLATRVVARVREAFGVELPLRTLFEASAVQAVAARVEALERAETGMSAPPLVPVPRDGAPLPLSFSQQRLWFIHQLQPGGTAYHMPYALRLTGTLDAGALGRALDALVARHETLRTRFASVDGEPVQVVDPAGPVLFARVDLSGRADAED